MDARDPRLNPIEGDVTQNRGGVRFYVRRIQPDGLILYQEEGTGDLMDCQLSDWRDCAADDTIIQCGDAPPPPPAEGGQHG